MGVTVGIRNLDHLLEAGDSGGEQEVIIAVPVDAGVGVLDSAAEAALLEDAEEVLAVKAVGSAGQDLALTHAIGNGEAGGDLVVVADIAELVEIDKDDKSEENEADHHHLTKEDGEVAEIKSLRFILGAAEDVRVVSQEVVDCLNDGPGAHRGRGAGLVAKLEVVEAHSITVETDRDPVELFKQKGSDPDAAVVL